jgi:hypothetical protein
MFRRPKPQFGVTGGIGSVLFGQGRRNLEVLREIE